MSLGKSQKVENRELFVDNSSVLKRFWDKREEWENFVNPPMRLTSQDKQGVLELFNRAMELSGKVNMRNNPLRKGLFVHLYGMRDEDKFPMGMEARSTFVQSLDDSISFELLLVSMDYFWGEKRLLYNFGLVTGEQAKHAREDDKAVRFTVVNNILPQLTNVLQSVNRWEEQMREHGFYILPTGLQSICPVGEGVLLNTWSETGKIVLSYLWPDGYGNKQVGGDIKVLLRRIIRMDVPNILEFYMGLPKNIRELLADL